MHEFGKCCADLADAMSSPPVSMLRVEENGVLYISVGYAKTDQGVGWFDHAVLYCPFCGTPLQSRAEIQNRSKA
jgi:hypothetical protein